MKDDIFNRIRPKQPLKSLKWFDIGIVTGIHSFGQFIIPLDPAVLASFQPVAQTAVATSSNTELKGDLLQQYDLAVDLAALAFFTCCSVALILNNCRSASSGPTLIWAPFALCSDGTFWDVISTVSGEYNYPRVRVFGLISIPCRSSISSWLSGPMAIWFCSMDFYEEFSFWA